MKIESVLVDKGISRAELARRLGVSRQAVAKWDEIPEKYLVEISEMSNEPPVGETPEGIWDWPWERIKSEICSLRAEMTDYEISRKFGLRVWELNKLIDRVRKAGADRVDI